MRKSNRVFTVLTVLFGILLSSAYMYASDWKPYPSSKKVSVIDTLHGVPISDPYRWLEDTDDSAVQAWTDAQNALTRKMLDGLPVRTKIKDRLAELWNYPRTYAPRKYGSRYFYLKNDGLQNHAVLYMKENLQSEPKVVLDPNTFAADGTSAMDWWYTSPDGEMIAYGVSESGSEDAVLHLKNVSTGEVLPLTIPRCRNSSVAWEKDHRGFYYTRFPDRSAVSEEDANYYERLYYHKMGADPKTDRLIYERPDKKELGFGAALSEDFNYLGLVIYGGSATGNEVYYLDRRKENDTFHPIVTGFEQRNYPYVIDSILYVMTTDGAPNFRIMTANMRNPAKEYWTELIPESKDLLESFQIIGGKLVLQYLHNACSQIKIYDLRGKLLQELPLPILGSTYDVSGKWDEPEMFFSFSSFVYPRVVMQYDVNTNRLITFEKAGITVNSDQFETKQVWFTSKDGTIVPMFLVHKKGIKLDGSNPTVLDGYGGFFISQSPYFTASRLPWMESGGIYALANLRGGGEFGEEWHRLGMLDKKQNVFDDFIAAAEWLIANKYTSSEKLAIQGGSNGGLLVGAVAMQRPELFKAVLCQVPLLDMIRFHRFLVARYWVPEYGSSESPEQFKYLLAYSPYQNVKSGARYPAMLITAGESDGRVHPLHARKMAALLQEANASDNPILLWVERKAGHGQGKPISMYLEDAADEWAFLFWQLGVTD